ncbi:MAG: hypothetical protein R3F65_04900 [bacterium]
MSDIAAEPATVRGALRAELRHLARRFARAFGWTLMVGVGLLAMFFAHGVLTAPPNTAATGLSPVLALPVAVAYSLFVAFFPALVVGLIALAWAAAGAAVLVPLVLIPLCLALAGWLSAELLADQTRAALAALTAAAGGHHWMVLGIGQAARIGPLVLVIALPLLVADLGLVVLDPGFLFELAVLAVELALITALALIPALLVSGVALSIGWWRGFRRRHAAALRR